MNNGLIGVEKDIVITTLMHDKSPIMIVPIVKNGVSVESMTLMSEEYKIYPQGILFFKRFLPQWKPIIDLLQENPSANVRMTITFFHRGRGLFFTSKLNLVQNGYALTMPSQVYKINTSEGEYSDVIHASIYVEDSAGILSKCVQVNEYSLFENRLWMQFPKSDFLQAKEVLKDIAQLEDASLLEYSNELIMKTKLIMYLPEKKLPEKNHFPFAVSITRGNREIVSTNRLEEEILQYVHPAFIPLCDEVGKDAHSIVGLLPRKVKTTPSDILETLLLLPICRYLVQENKRGTFFSSHTSVLDILCITDSAIILGSHTTKKNIISTLIKNSSNEFPLSEGSEYTLQLCIPSDSLLRTITVTISVKKVYKYKEKAACAMCHFKNLQEEDKRLLYEKFYNTRLR